ncbi:carbon-nitrogen hydrolase [Xylariomycetidae sp. FL2044]|nr:carbon-nitrogen hydrolase [Xylariomycetidae sp. FL2044]
MAKAAIGQICSSNSMTHNLEQCVGLVGRAARAGAQVLFLPEASDYVGTSPQESLALARTESESPFVRGLQAAAARNRIAVHVGIHVPVSVVESSSSSSTSSSTSSSAAAATGGGGGVKPKNPVMPTVPISPETETETKTENKKQQPTSIIITKLYNRTIYIQPTGAIDPSASYSKLHLFDYPAASLVESRSTQAGADFAPPIASPVGRLGSLICFDLRFPEAALRLTTTTNQPPSPSAPAQILLYPSAFTIPTGRAHWEPLLRARAIETQSWVVAAAQVGRHNDNAASASVRTSYGRSMVVDPWGKVVLELKGVVPRVLPRRQAKEEGGDGDNKREGDEEEKEEEEEEEVVEWEAEEGAVGQLGIVDVDLGLWEKVREQMPLIRRTDVYPEI